MTEMNHSLPQVIILAAGEGSRLRPHTLDRPKCLVEVAGESLLERHLRVLGAAGLHEINIITGYRGQQLEGRGAKVWTNPRYAETNMVWTLFCADEILNRDTIVAYGDIVYAAGHIEKLLATDADVAVVVDRQWEVYWRARFENPLDDAETLKVNAAGHITEIGKKPLSMADIQAQYIGLMKFSAAGLEKLRQQFQAAQQAGSMCGKPVEKAYMTDLIQALIDSGSSVVAVPVDGQWVEVDSVSDMELPIVAQRLSEICEGL